MGIPPKLTMLGWGRFAYRVSCRKSGHRARPPRRGHGVAPELVLHDIANISCPLLRGTMIQIKFSIMNQSGIEALRLCPHAARVTSCARQRAGAGVISTHVIVKAFCIRVLAKIMVNPQRITLAFICKGRLR